VPLRFCGALEFGQEIAAQHGSIQLPLED